MKAVSILISTLLLLPVVAFAKSPKAQIDEAIQKAAAAKKDLLLVFSGTSWSGSSQELEKNILGSPEFQKESDKDFIRLLIEIPASRDNAHQDLLDFEKIYQLQTIPVVICMDGLGRPYSYLVPSKKEPAEFLKEIQELRKVRVERDKMFESALKVKGREKAELMVKALKTLPQQIIARFYEKELEMIAEADPKNETAYVGEVRKAEALKAEQERFNKIFAERNYDEVIKQARAEAKGLEGEDAQRMKLYEVRALYGKKEYDAAIKEVEALKQIDPESELGKRASQFAKQIEGAKKRAERMKEMANKPRKPVVSKPVAIVTDVEQLRKDAKKAEEELAAGEAQLKKVVDERGELAQKISETETALKGLREKEKASAEAVKKATGERDKLARKAKAMKEVLENHIAMEKRKREIAELEKQAAELQKKADELRRKADEVRKGK